MCAGVYGGVFIKCNERKTQNSSASLLLCLSRQEMVMTAGANDRHLLLDLFIDYIDLVCIKLSDTRYIFSTNCSIEST